MSVKPKIINIVQGDYAVSVDPNVVMTTILGSCVSACIFDTEIGVGGMNHFLRAHGKKSHLGDPKYGTDAMAFLIRRILRLGGRQDRLQAKLFGGARVTEQVHDIGELNAAFAKQFLEDANIPCLSASLGGTDALRLQFVPATGAARVMRIVDPVEMEL